MPLPSCDITVIDYTSELGPSTLAVPEQLSNDGDENVGHSPAESGTDFWAHMHH